MTDYYADLSAHQNALTPMGLDKWADELELALRGSATSSEAFAMTGLVLKRAQASGELPPALAAEAQSLWDLGAALFEGRT